MAETLPRQLLVPLQQVPGTLNLVSKPWALAGSITGFAGVAALMWCWAVHGFDLPDRIKIRSAASTDPGLLKKGSKFESFKTASGHVYPKIRTFYSEPTQAKGLPNDLPLLVFMHGLGGSIAQFQQLLTALTQYVPCLAIDLPGCGLSDERPKSIDAYTTTSFAKLMHAAIDRYRKKDVNQRVILIGHSMGCSINALLASSTSPLGHLCSDLVASVIAICPRSSAPSQENLLQIQRLSWVPSMLFDLIRMADRRGGVHSASVARVVGPRADLETKKLQLRFNQQSKSSAFQKIIMGLRKQEMFRAESGEESLLGKRVWSGIKAPLFLIAAQDDKLAPPEEVDRIKTWLQAEHRNSNTHPERQDSRFESAIVVEQGAPEAKTSIKFHSRRTSIPAIPGDASIATEQLTRYTSRKQPGVTRTAVEPVTGSQAIEQEEIATKHSLVMKISIFPSPSSHGLLYDNSDVRILSGLIQHFLAEHVDKRLSPAWQLQHLTTSGKWDVKNLTKWQSIAPCSEPIAGVFRAMKTMREVDDVHCPKEFVRLYSWKAVPRGVAMVVDISLDTPVYDKQGLEDGGVEYHKFPTVSKQPPTVDEVEAFVSLIDGLRRSPRITDVPEGHQAPTIGVHCHYGFNRTGFFIVSYMVERLGWKLQDALKEFAEKREPGIKHDYFVSELYMRYAIKMERRNTIVE